MVCSSESTRLFIHGFDASAMSSPSENPPDNPLLGNTPGIAPAEDPVLPPSLIADEPVVVVMFTVSFSVFWFREVNPESRKLDDLPGSMCWCAGGGLYSMSPAKAAAASSRGILMTALVIVLVVETLRDGEVERETEEETGGEGDSRSCGKTVLDRVDDTAGEEEREIDWNVSIDCEEVVLGGQSPDDDVGGKVDVSGLKIGSGIEAVGEVVFSDTVLDTLVFFTGARVFVDTDVDAMDGVGAFKGPVDVGRVETGGCSSWLSTLLMLLMLELLLLVLLATELVRARGSEVRGEVTLLESSSFVAITPIEIPSGDASASSDVPLTWVDVPSGGVGTRDD